MRTETSSSTDPQSELNGIRSSPSAIQKLAKIRGGRKWLYPPKRHHKKREAKSCLGETQLQVALGLGLPGRAKLLCCECIISFERWARVLLLVRFKRGRTDILPPDRTNITEPRAVYATTRGELASNWLLSDDSLDAFSFNLTGQHHWKSYAGFNLLLLEPKWASSRPKAPSALLSYKGEYATNSGGGGIITARSLHEDEVTFVGGITNGIESLDGKEWPKLVEGTTKLREALAELDKDASAEQIVERLSEILRSVSIAIATKSGH